MKRSEAARVVAVLGAFFPSKDIREDTAELWENAIVEFDVADALEATQVLGEGLRFLPSLAEFVAAIKDARNERLRNQAPALPTGRADPDMCEGCGGFDQAGFVHFWLVHASEATKASAERQAKDYKGTFARWVPAAKAAEAAIA